VKRFTRTLLTSAPWWLALGIANVLVGVAIALRPIGSRDVGWLWIWTRIWLQGTNPYHWPIPADYPPWAVVLLSPLGMVPAGALPALWAAAGISLAIAVAWLGPKAAAVESPPVRLAIGIFLSWAAVRYGLGNGQFALLVVACGLAAVWLARRGSAWSGVLLGAAMVKPHLGIAFLAWAVVAARWRTIGIAAVSLAAATVAFGARLQESPLSVIVQYLRQVNREVRGEHALRGSVELRPLLESIIGDSPVAVAVHAAIVAAGFAAIVWTLSRQPPPGRERLALPLFCLWTLVSAFHNSYDLVLLWPVWVLLWERCQRRPHLIYSLAAVQAALVIGVPGLWWKVGGSAAGAGPHFDRVLVAGLLVYLVAVSSRRPVVGKIHGRELMQTTPCHPPEVMLQ
jgi:hypothetical protein